MKRITSLLIITLAIVVLLCACVKDDKNTVSGDYRTYYEVFVRSFYDSDADGIGDLKGVLQKLDYLNDGKPGSKDSLHIGGIWLMPVMPSPTYHKYDVTDYYAIDPEYGTMQDFEALMAKCKERDVSLIIDLVLNHTSSEHEWFKSASVSIGIPPCGQTVCTNEKLCREHNPYCKYYNFSAEPQDGYAKVPLYSDWYYECRFWTGMPDLNLDEPLVREEIEKIMKFWLDKGVSGFRLDAVTSFFTGNNEKNAEFLKWLKTEAEKLDKDCYFVCEAWSTPNVTKELYSSGINSMFNFPFSQVEGLFIPAVRSENGSKVAQSLANWQSELLKISPKSIDALFLSNHDNGRSAGMLSRNTDMEKMAAALYILAPGNSFIYYGEEVGLTGSGKDENKRLPMLWSIADKTGITNPPPNAEFFEQSEQGVKEQLADKESLLRYYIKLIDIKNSYIEIAGGLITAIETPDSSIVAFSCAYEGDEVIVLHNLSTEPVTLTVDKTKVEYKKIAECISVNGDKSKLKGDTLSMPGRSSVILK